jgi:hypothetical protein
VPDLKEAATSLAHSIRELGRQSHAAVAMRLITMLEYDLERCLLRTFRPLNRKMRKRLFDAYGPIATFAAKIDLTLALGITTEATHKELHKMRKIRNAFAHSRDGLSLDTEPVKTLFYTLARPAGITGSYLEQFVKCGVLIDDELEAYLVSKGETEDVSRALKKASEISETPKEEAIPTPPLAASDSQIVNSEA